MTDSNMEESLLLPKYREDEQERNKSSSDSSASTLMTWGSFFEEVKRLGCIAGPMVAVILSQYLLQVISMMMVGHLGELALSSTAIAISLSGVTGFSLFLGMASALETLCGQAYGAKQYQKLGLQTYTAIFSLNLVCLPLSLIWICMEKILIFIGQDPVISHEAGKFTTWLLPALFAYATLQPLIRSISNQYFLLVKCDFAGVIHEVFLCLFKTRAPISKEIFQGIGEFFRFAVPSAIMICLEWWSFELLILLSGLLPNPALETSVLSVCLQTISTLYAIPYGFGAAASTRVSNELGAGNPQGARIATCAGMFLAVTETSIITTTLFACRNVFGYTFSNEKEVIDYVTTMAPLVCLSVILDSLQGRNWVAAYRGLHNLGAFYLCGIPVAATLAFWVQLRGRGLWIGIQVGSFVQTILLSFVTSCTNWEKQAIKARERIFEGRPSEVNGLCDKAESNEF
ncbi:unnamed protein product [Prunus armeniaca]|uniref:Protein DETOXIFICATION n=1 Tax=Prunus armeniaca TaxID=36596 RepID=A0A6J5W297_PRUAR|nr:unnamed protein product [Prunus armeniaca]